MRHPLLFLFKRSTEIYNFLFSERLTNCKKYFKIKLMSYVVRIKVEGAI